MKLKEVKIRNYRSIEDLTLEFDPRCRVLVGINESGKTNILDALSLLDGNIQPNRKDKRIRKLTEGPITESHVIFIFSFERDEKEHIWKYFFIEVFASNKDSPFATNANGKKISLYHFVSSIINEGLYNIDILNESKSAKYWGMSQEYNILDTWKKVVDNCPENVEIEE